MKGYIRQFVFLGALSVLFLVVPALFAEEFEDLTGKGSWLKGAAHIHTNYSAVGRWYAPMGDETAITIMFDHKYPSGYLDPIVEEANIGGLHFLVITDHNNEEICSDKKFVQYNNNGPLILICGNEYTPDSIKPHMGLWSISGNIKYDPLDPSSGNAFYNPYGFLPKYEATAESVRKENGIVILNHPANNLYHWESYPSKFDGIEVWCGPWKFHSWPVIYSFGLCNRNDEAIKKWEQLIKNKGESERVTAVGGTDNMALSHDLTGTLKSFALLNNIDLNWPVDALNILFSPLISGLGLPARIYEPTNHVYAKDQSAGSIIEGFKKGHVYITQNPWIEVDLNAIVDEDGYPYKPDPSNPNKKQIEAIVGQTIFAKWKEGEEETEEISFVARIRNCSNGERIIFHTFDGKKTEYMFTGGDFALPHKPKKDDYVWIEVRDANGNLLALTNPIYIAFKASLANGKVDPLEGTLETGFKYSVTYKDPKGRPPKEGVQVVIDQKDEYQMVKDSSNDDFKNGVIYTLSGQKLALGNHTYRFKAIDIDGKSVKGDVELHDGPLVSEINARIKQPGGLAVDWRGNVYVTDQEKGSVMMVTEKSITNRAYVINLISGLNKPGDIDISPDGTFLSIAEANAQVTRRYLGISGTIKDSMGNPVELAKIRLNTSRHTFSTTSNGGGIFTILDVLDPDNFFDDTDRTADLTVEKNGKSKTIPLRLMKGQGWMDINLDP